MNGAQESSSPDTGAAVRWGDRRCLASSELPVAVAAGALGSSGVLRRSADAAGCRLARDAAAAGFTTVARAARDMTAIQKRAGRPR
jgi:hypothetical protein